MMQPRALRICGALLCGFSVAAPMGAGAPDGYVGVPDASRFPASETALEAMRATGNLEAERRHVWHLFAALTRPSPDGHSPIFLTWFGAGEVFADSRSGGSLSSVAPRNILQSFALPPLRRDASADSQAPPLIVRAHYNLAAYRHIREQRLFEAGHLAALEISTRADGAIGGSIPAFPRESVVLKTVWWPVPEGGIVALPVWDSSAIGSRTGGNDYTSWARVVAVTMKPLEDKPLEVCFMGRCFSHLHAVGIDNFYHIPLDEPLAAQLMTDPAARKLALMLLGRPLRAKDQLVMVAMHVATREITDWVWGTFWWHDRPDRGPYSTLRPDAVESPWRRYLMNVAFDPVKPREADGSAHIAYNPWLEARFPDSGHGGGIVSNCMSCHRRASTAIDRPFVVTRGLDDPGSRDGKAPLQTSSLWSIAMEAR